MKIVILDGATTGAAEIWSPLEQFATVEAYERTATDEIVARCADADIVLTNKVPMTADTISQLPKLRYIGVLATGYNIVDCAAAAKAGIVVTNIPSYSTQSVAQHAIALLLAITNRVESYAAAVKFGVWTKCPDFTFRIEDWAELDGKVFGIVGYGNTGRATAHIAAALGMTIAVVTSKPQSELPDGYIKMEMDEMFAKADVVSLHCPLTPATKHLVNSERLAMMKPSAILLNTSRGPVVDAEALTEALRDNKIFAAGIDVLDVEPPTADNPLLNAPRCFITPHIAWASTEARARLVAIAIANVEAFVNGSPRNRVN